MTCDGVWSVEMQGLYGWERIATAFMKNGEYYAASANHYSVGSYRRDGDDLKISTVVKQYGEVRPVFGKKSVTIQLIIEKVLDKVFPRFLLFQ